MPRQKRNRFNLRLSNSDLAMLEWLANHLQASLSEVIRRAIRELYERLHQ